MDSPDSVPTEARSPRRMFRRMAPWAASALFHGALLVVLALVVISRLMPGGTAALSFEASGASDADELALEEPYLEVVSQPDERDGPDIDPSSAPSSTEEVNVELPEMALTSELPDQPHEMFALLPAKDLALKVAKATSGEKTEKRLIEPSPTQLQEAGDVEGAVDGVMGEIGSELAEGDLLVVWLFDASISLVDDRQRVASRLAELLENMGGQPGAASLFMNAAVAYGNGVRELVAPTKYPARIIDAVRSVPIDNTGMENVFGAISWTIRKYGGRWKHGMKVVVWTDESGDDAARLEETIALCRRRNVSVSVVGPSAVLGRERGTHVWIHAQTGTVFLLPVDRGPDCVLAERLAMAYWFSTAMPQWVSPSEGREILAAGMGRKFPPWYGGPQLEAIASGFGPYALTRLTLATGGSYTILDRPADRGPFRLERMRPYLPDYRSRSEIAGELYRHPLRKAVVKAAELTLSSGGLGTPRCWSTPVYLSPPDFRARFELALRQQDELSVRILQATRVALAGFGADGMEKEYDAEPSARWRAWYDLTRGRLLAVQARCAEYHLACAQIQPVRRALNPATNFVAFGPSGQLRSPSETGPLVKEARRLLERCVDANRDTPWAYLAQRELDYPVGITVNQMVLPPPPPETPSPAMPRRSGPAVTPPKL